jgi:hypothetical protein
VDHETRALFTERVLPASVTLPSYASGDYAPLHSWAKTAFQVGMKAEASVVLECRASGPGLHKSYEFAPSGELAVSLSWEPGAFPPDAVFTTELSLVRQVEVQSAPAADVWTFPITTTAKSERGLEETVQGQSVTLRWPATAGRAVVRLAV